MEKKVHPGVQSEISPINNSVLLIFHKVNSGVYSFPIPILIWKDFKSRGILCKEFPPFVVQSRFTTAEMRQGPLKLGIRTHKRVGPPAQLATSIVGTFIS